MVFADSVLLDTAAAVPGCDPDHARVDFERGFRRGDNVTKFFDVSEILSQILS